MDNVRIRNPYFFPSYNPATLTYGTFASTSYADVFTSHNQENNAGIDTDRDKRNAKRRTAETGQCVPVPSVFGIEQYSIVTEESSATTNNPDIAASSTSGQAGQVVSNEQTSSPAACPDKQMSARRAEMDTVSPLSPKRSEMREDNPIT